MYVVLYTICSLILFNMVDNDCLLSQFGGLEKSSLWHILKIDEVSVDEDMEVIHQSPYFDDDNLIKYLQNNINTFLVLSLNCQS